MSQKRKNKAKIAFTQTIRVSYTHTSRDVSKYFSTLPVAKPTKETNSEVLPFIYIVSLCAEQGARHVIPTVES